MSNQNEEVFSKSIIRKPAPKPEFSEYEFPMDKTPIAKEKFPHIYKSLELCWGTNEFHKYLSSLYLIERNDRSGFPFEMLKEIEVIAAVHDTKFPHLKVKLDKWDFAYKR